MEKYTPVLDFINERKGVLRLRDGYAKTLQDYWDKEIEPFLPSKEVMEGIFNLLLRYCEDPDAIFAIRLYADRKESEVELDEKECDVKADSTLRRGFLACLNNEFSVVFTDNDFSFYFMKMAMNSYVPDYDDFKKAMITHKFPVHFNVTTKYEMSKRAFPIDGINPGYGAAGYKLSHIVDAGAGFWIKEKNKEMSITDWCNIYFPRGKYHEWLFDEEKQCFVRHYELNLSDEEKYMVKKLLVAHFLRFACPLNHVLTPKKIPFSCQESSVQFERNDIGEDKKFQKYAIYRFMKKYGEAYNKYLEYIMINSDFTGADNGDTEIDLHYGWSIGEENRKKGYVNQENINRVIEFMLCRQEYCLADDISDLADEGFCKYEINLSKPVLAECNGLYKVRDKWSKNDVKNMVNWLLKTQSLCEDDLVDILQMLQK